jgi:hypothetical protein
MGQSSQESNPVASSSNFIMDGASRLMSTVFGKKPPVKSIQLAVAARKVVVRTMFRLEYLHYLQDEEEKERKAQVLRNAETRRLLAKQRKADEEKARADGEQKRAKEEQERRKRERDETTDKRPIKLPMKKVRSAVVRSEPMADDMFVASRATTTRRRRRFTRSNSPRICHLPLSQACPSPRES